MVLMSSVVVGQGDRIRVESPQLSLPGVPVRIDEPRYDDHVGRIDDLGLGTQVRPDRQDLLTLDQHIALGKVPDLGIHADDDSAFEQDPPLRVTRKVLEALEHLVIGRVIGPGCAGYGPGDEPSCTRPEKVPARGTAVHGRARVVTDYVRLCFIR